MTWSSFQSLACRGKASRPGRVESGGGSCPCWCCQINKEPTGSSGAHGAHGMGLDGIVTMPGLSRSPPCANPCTLEQRSAMFLITPIKNLSSLVDDGQTEGTARGVGASVCVIEQRSGLIYQCVCVCVSVGLSSALYGRWWLFKRLCGSCLRRQRVFVKSLKR